MSEDLEHLRSAFPDPLVLVQELKAGDLVPFWYHADTVIAELARRVIALEKRLAELEDK